MTRMRSPSSGKSSPNEENHSCHLGSIHGVNGTCGSRINTESHGSFFIQKSHSPNVSLHVSHSLRQKPEKLKKRSTIIQAYLPTLASISSRDMRQEMEESIDISSMDNSILETL